MELRSRTAPAWRRALSALSFSTTRSLLHSRGRLALTTAIASLYFLGAMYLGEMLVFIQTGPGYLLITDPTSFSPQNWAYPAIEIVAPGVVIVIPILATITMVLVSTFVGVGMAAALVLAWGWLRERRAGLVKPAGASSLAAGLTPVMLGFLTLGACCSTALAGAAGAGALSNAGAAAGNPLFTDLWALSVFQIGIMWTAVVAQEYLFRLYLATVPPTAGASEPASPGGAPTPPVTDEAPSIEIPA